MFSFWQNWKWLVHEGTSSVEGLWWLLGTCERLLSIHEIEEGGSRRASSKDTTTGKSQGWIFCWNVSAFSLIGSQQAEERPLALLLGGKGQFQCLPSQTGWRAAEAECTALGWHKSPHKSFSLHLSEQQWGHLNQTLSETSFAPH